MEVEKKAMIHRVYFVKLQPSPLKVQKKEYEKQYHLLNRERIRILQELDHLKGEAYQINQKITWFSYLDDRIQWKMSEVENLERWINQDKVVQSLPIRSIPRTTGFLCLSEKDDQNTVNPDRRRCQKRMIKNGRIDIEYLQHVKEFEHVPSKEYGVTQELDYVIESMVQRIRHGNKKRADEMKIYQEISELKKTKEVLISQEPQPQRYHTRELRSKRDTDWKRYLQHKIKILLDEIENLKRKQVGRTARVRRLKGELEHVTKNISYLNKKLENVNSKKHEAYKRANELGEQKEEKRNDTNSSYNEYLSFRRSMRELAQKGDVELKNMCNMQVEEFMRQWNAYKEFRENYKNIKLVRKQDGEE